MVCDFTSAMRSVAAGTFVEVGVYRDSIVSNCMHLTRYVGTVNPPFSAIPALSPFTRQSIANLTPSQISSLRHGMQVMMSRSATDPTSFSFQANIHGTYDTATTAAQMQAWNQCEHGSYYFLSWHRMYLYYFDRILRAAAGDPSLVLPYWNWTDSTQRTLPLAFRQPADATNSLYVAPPNRPAGLDAGTAALGSGTVDYSIAFADGNFDSPKGSGDSFGGQTIAPMQFNFPHGAFESQPHDVVHSALGGLMGDPDTAAEDPIFWLHHANIDRMWNHWLQQGGGRHDPTDAAWLGSRFTFYDEASHAVYLTGSEVVADAAQLNYRYDDDVSAQHMTRRTVQVAKAAMPMQASLLASSKAGRISLDGTSVKARVQLTEDVVKRLFAMAKNEAGRKAFLRIADIRYEKSNGIYYEVYINPSGADLNITTPGYIGNLSLFGLKPHRMPGRPAMPAASIYVDYDISRSVLAALTRDHSGLSVVLVPRGLFDLSGHPLPVPAETQGTVAGTQLLLR